jgi:hypothetical protein
MLDKAVERWAWLEFAIPARAISLGSRTWRQLFPDLRIERRSRLLAPAIAMLALGLFGQWGLFIAVLRNTNRAVMSMPRNLLAPDSRICAPRTCEGMQIVLVRGDIVGNRPPQLPHSLDVVSIPSQSSTELVQEFL